MTSTNARTAIGPTSAQPGRRLQRHAEGGQREDFFRLLRPHLGFLRDYARREIRMLEREGSLHRGEVTVDDLLDQVLILAWERFADRPRRLSLDLWLTDLLQEALEQWIKQEHRPHVSLEAQGGRMSVPDEVPQEDEEEWWAELMGEEETLTLEDLIPGLGWDGNLGEAGGRRSSRTDC